MKTLYVKTAKEWRSWLRKNYNKETEIRLVFYKKHTGKPTLSYKESLEEALCFGWIDGLKKRLDDERYTFRFSPRKEKSKWSPANIKLAEKLIKEKRMAKPGLAAFERKLHYKEEILKVKNSKKLIISHEIKKALMANKKVWKNFNALAPSHKKQYVWWIDAAKRPETRERRLKETISFLKQNKKLGMK